MIRTDTAVIGGGAAGLMAAITAAGSGASTLVIEHMDRVARKLPSTGNGKCNYTNALQGVSFYRGEDPAFVMPVFAQFGLPETLAFFQELGIRPKERNGYYYPSSGQASSIPEVLCMEARYRKVSIVTSCVIRHIRKRRGGFEILTDGAAYFAKTVIFATGLLAAPKTGSDGSAFPLITSLGHHFVEVVPALVQLEAGQKILKGAAGVRTEASLTLQIPPGEDVADVFRERGELQLTEYGISGIPVFQISRYAARALAQKKQVSVEINFAPWALKEELYELIGQRFGRYARGKTSAEAMTGLFDRKLNAVLLKEAGIGSSLPAEKVGAPQRRKLCAKIRHLRVEIVNTKGFASAQACAGGVDTAELYAGTMESRLLPGLYFAGEVVDIDGACGGYNLQWAWSSGYVAGRHAALRACGKPDPGSGQKYNDLQKKKAGET